MNILSVAMIGSLCLLAVAGAGATGLATCASGAESGWKSQEDLKKQLTAKGWKIRRIKIDGGCYEVYAINDKGERVESYFHPVTFDHVLTSKH